LQAPKGEQSLSIDKLQKASKEKTFQELSRMQDGKSQGEACAVTDKDNRPDPPAANFIQ